MDTRDFTLTLSRMHALLMAAVPVMFAARIVTAWPRLPESMATHFTLGGTPDGWLGRWTFCLIAVAALLVQPITVAMSRINPPKLAFHWGVSVVLARAMWMVIDYNLGGASISIPAVLAWGAAAAGIAYVLGGIVRPGA